MRQTGQRQHDGCPGAVLAGLEATCQQTEAEDAERQRDGERELARHRALHVAPVDREALVEEEQHAAEGEQFGERIAEPGKTAEGETAQRQGDDAADHHDLEGDAVGQHHVQGHDHQRRDDHVEAVHRQPRVPVVAPAGELAVRQQFVAQERGAHHMGAHVATRRGVVAQHQRGLHHLRRRPGAATHHDNGDHQPNDALGGPRSIEPRHRAPHDAPHRPRDDRRFGGGDRVGFRCRAGREVRLVVGCRERWYGVNGRLVAHGVHPRIPSQLGAVIAGPPTADRWR